MRPQVWRDYELSRDQDLADWEERPELQEACAGNTGIACFDFWVRELVETKLPAQSCSDVVCKYLDFYTAPPLDVGC